ncbi:hypothetical protein JTE90_008822 [Oedothorax gibbosus]|uniref:Gustatory receptor n=1 Tax=Oedothorax gibbosus TaxID=931172 RepID=A0AAV6V511_9ARAC|nr:hypothetical protein JTE90_008822 [Oedothorax gibbosus]
MSIVLSVYAVTICGNLSNLLIFSKRKTLYSSMRNLYCLASVLDSSINFGSSSIADCEIILFAIGMAIIAACLSVFFYRDLFMLLLREAHFPPFIPNEWKTEYLSFALLCITASYCFSVLTGGLVYLTCKNIYKTIGDIFIQYSLKLKGRTQATPSSWTVEYLSDDISVFKNITLRVSEIEEAFGIHVLLLYATMICGFFNTVSVLIQNSDRLDSVANYAFIACTFCAAAIAFVQMSRYGSYIDSQVQGLKLQMIVCSDEFIRSSPSKSTMDVFNYLFEIVMKSQIEVTGNGMFVINYRLVLTIISTLITYSVLILQLDNKNSISYSEQAYNTNSTN